MTRRRAAIQKAKEVVAKPSDSPKEVIANPSELPIDNLNPEAAQKKLAEVVADGKKAEPDVIEKSELEIQKEKFALARNAELERHRSFIQNYLNSNKLVLFQTRHESQFGVNYSTDLIWADEIK